MTAPDFGTSDFGHWQPIATAPRDGSRILVVVGATEQGSGEVDVVRWERPHNAGEKCWVAVDSVRGCEFFYTDGELVFWMKLPTNFPTQRSTIAASGLPEPPASEEAAGSGI